ncbi:MAG: hypothetical protein J6A15_09235 [Clostridia bacterium]|nr:hypothetical protein [Clostridia bacterium]
MKKNLFFTLCFSFVPGAGQMYQGYMKRGISILILFAAFCAIFATVAMPIFAIPLPVLYIYSFFDTFNIRNTIDKENKQEDKYLWDTSDLEELKNSFNVPSAKKLIGILLIFVGIYMILCNILPQILYDLDLNEVARYLRDLGSYITPITIALLSIVFGLKLINKK